MHTTGAISESSQACFLSLKVAASVDRHESYTKKIGGQIRCITAEFKPKGAVAWNVNYINVFIPHQGSQFSKCDRCKIPPPRSHRGLYRPHDTNAWATTHFQRRCSPSPRAAKVRSPSRIEVAKRDPLAAETWQSNRPHISLKTTIGVPLLGTVIEQMGTDSLRTP